jgi:hypothetical protein
MKTERLDSVPEDIKSEILLDLMHGVEDLAG